MLLCVARAACYNSGGVPMANAEESVMVATATRPPYVFASPAEADITYLIIAWFAVTESAALGIFPIHATIQTARTRGAGYIASFFEHGLEHFRDEQAHSNMWCRALLDFSRHYPDVVERVQLPGWQTRIMLSQIGKPHSVLDFSIDCLAFEVVMRALYDVTAPRLDYPPIKPIFARITADEANHTEFDRAYITGLLGELRGLARLRVGWRFWRNTGGVLITVQPLLAALHRYKPLARGEFAHAFARYVAEADIPGGETLAPRLIARFR